MEPIFASKARQLFLHDPIRQATRALGDHADLEEIKRIAALEPAHDERPRAWETIQGVLKAQPRPISAPGWNGYRLILETPHGEQAIVTGQLIEEDGTETELLMGEVLTVTGYRIRGKRSLVAVKVERGQHHLHHEQHGGTLTLGPNSEVFEGRDGQMHHVGDSLSLEG